MTTTDDMVAADLAADNARLTALVELAEDVVRDVTKRLDRQTLSMKAHDKVWHSDGPKARWCTLTEDRKSVDEVFEERDGNEDLVYFSDHTYGIDGHAMVQLRYLLPKLEAKNLTEGPKYRS